ncbi:hypothetical protein A2716_02155 [candidate division WWE3 bacterium RIFCSPHIGHO2_01_FULL_40_23]|uniref:Ferredoxin n=1 Tax=candidate division WWE3 bacterium RIFCSPLOWO2_01_FULL_41_18 TaxID=1802625 RepID=A0A1F4VFQ6_UNCKA|nr:MAG: hypothetical protein A2716_02155 [candidate division WWE3 bacterium RIFCSPHIGHO2_01_FULL_40_23]OGC55790.1 MAG: hypothetical protein A3A78_02005 [candidate division WWE3 bacterium RIFCSPLOWO2_01_FULL_41_18]
MKKITKVIVDRNLCIGAGTCVTTAGEVFKLDEENKAVVVNIKGADISDLLIAAQSCPTAAISLYDEDGNPIFPSVK